MSTWHTGLPHVSYFPFDTLEAAVARPDRFQLDSSAAPGLSRKVQVFEKGSLSAASASITVPKEVLDGAPEKTIDLSTALQYGTAQGYPPLYSFLRQFTRENLHPNVPYAGGPEIILTCGSTDGFSKVLEAFANPWDPDRHWTRDREGLLVEEFAYRQPVQLARPKGLNIVPVPMDAEGMLPAGLKEVLANWDFSKGKRPHLMYTVT